MDHKFHKQTIGDTTMRTIQVSLNEMEAKVYELCKLATKGSDDGCEFCFDDVAVPARKKLGLTVEETKGYLGSLKKKEVLMKMYDGYYDFVVTELTNDWAWCYLYEKPTIEFI